MSKTSSTLASARKAGSAVFAWIRRRAAEPSHVGALVGALGAVAIAVLVVEHGPVLGGVLGALVGVLLGAAAGQWWGERRR